MDQDKIGKFIARVRKDRGLTQDDIARKLGITSQSVSKWECGINFPDVFLLLDLCEILEISVDELLNGERKNSKSNTNKNQCLVKRTDNKSKYKCKKSIVLFLVLGLFLLFVIGMKFITNKEKEFEYESIDKDSFIVEESLNYIRFDSSINKSLLQKLFDNNESIVTKDDLNNDEKMFLVLNNYKRENKLNDRFNARFDHLQGFIFEDSSFLNEYGKEGAFYTIQNRINYSNYNGIFDYEEIFTTIEGERNIYFYVVDAKENDSSLIIDFRVAFLRRYVYSNFVVFYKEANSYHQVLQKDIEEIDLEKEELGEEFNTFRFTLKLVEGKPYFESLEKI